MIYTLLLIPEGGVLLGILGGGWCRHGHRCRSSPLCEVRIPRRTAARAHFVVINKGAGQFFLSSNLFVRCVYYATHCTLYIKNF